MTLTFQEIAEILGIRDEINWSPRYNIAPGQMLPAVVNDGEYRLRLFQWGLIPFWAKEAASGNFLFNARAETVDSKASFKHALQKQRCLILADGFYEWRRAGKQKIPYRFTLKTRTLFAFAGLWDAWQSPGGEILYSCSIITTEANDLLRPIHNRMPVILEKDQEKLWLDPARSAPQDIAPLKSLLRPYPAEDMTCYEVSSLVNSARNESSECIRPVNKQITLF